MSMKAHKTYQVIARRWRPQNFDEVVFQDHISRTLKNSLKNGRISHAYIFAGPRGVGKTTTARILAKALNCVQGPTAEPCGTCENCLEIKNGSAFDVIEIDGASNRGIENIRDLREKVHFAPVKGRYKVYIVDEVHMLTKEAFNALLKTLEEPPAHVVFIFATTEMHQVPDTILSRCQKYFFKKISIEAIVEHLQYIVKEEGYAIEEQALYSIARSADGAMRDAQSLLDQVISFSDGSINLADALSILGVVPLASYLAIFENIAGAQAQAIIDDIEAIMATGIDIPRYAAGMIDLVRSLRLVRHNIPIQSLLGFSDDEVAHVQKVAAMFHDEELSAFYKITLQLETDLRYSTNERVNLEMALLDMMAVKKRPSLTSIVQKIDTLYNEKKKSKVTPAIAALEKKVPAREDKQDPPVYEPAFLRSGNGPDETGFKKHWSGFLEHVKIIKQYLYQKLIQAEVNLQGTTLALSAKIQDKGFYDLTLDSQDITFIEQELSKRLGTTITVKSLDQAASGNEPEEVPLPDAEMVTSDDYSHLETDHPVVSKIVDIFHGEIVEKGE